MFFERSFMIISFSSRHGVQFRFPFLPADSCLTMAHLIENCRFSFFRFQTCLDNSVSCLYFSLRRDFKWFLYLVLKSLAVTPMYDVRWCDFSFINYAPCQAFSVSWAVHALSAVAEFFVVFVKSVSVFFSEWFYCACLKRTSCCRCNCS